MMRLSLPLLLLGCTSAPATCPNPEVGVGTGKLAVATATDEFDTGTLTLVDLATGETCDDLLTLTGDTVLQVVDDRLVSLDRKGFDRVRGWTLGEWGEPSVEFSVGDEANPHDVVRCGGNLVTSLYGEDGETALGVFDDEGRRLASVDLSAFADGDGRPEVSDLASDGTTLWAAAQRLDRDDDWTPADSGALIQVDCGTYAVTDSWSVPANPRMAGDPASELIIAGSDASVITWTPDGGLHALATAPAGVSAVATDSSGRGLLVTNDELWFAASCVDASGLRPLVTTDAYLSSAVVDSDGFGWLAVRGGWQPPDAPEGARVGPAPGLWKVDLDRCEIVDEIATALAPYDLATW